MLWWVIPTTFVCALAAYLFLSRGAFSVVGDLAGRKRVLFPHLPCKCRKGLRLYSWLVGCLKPKITPVGTSESSPCRRLPCRYIPVQRVWTSRPSGRTLRPRPRLATRHALQNAENPAAAHAWRGGGLHRRKMPRNRKNPDGGKAGRSR